MLVNQDCQGATAAQKSDHVGHAAPPAFKQRGADGRDRRDVVIVEGAVVHRAIETANAEPFVQKACADHIVIAKMPRNEHRGAAFGLSLFDGIKAEARDWRVGGHGAKFGRGIEFGDGAANIVWHGAHQAFAYRGR